jgi:hypothetical protein
MSFWARIALVTGSIIFSLASLEVGCRVVRLGPSGLLEWPNLARARTSNIDDGLASCGFAYDAVLGWTMPANCVSPGYNVVDGLRRTSNLPPRAEPAILVTGSSFAMGSEVTDEETWPAHLQAMTGRRVANGGVGGYSLDQTVLRTEKLVALLKPPFVVASFTPDDIRRNELRTSWSRPKPYFEVADGRLEIRNVPVPGGSDMAVPMPIAGRLLGWSALADLVADRLSIFDGWYYDEARAAPPGSGARVACLLMQRLAGLGVPVMVVAEYPRSHWRADAAGRSDDVARTGAVLACAAQAGLIPLDMSQPLATVVAAQGVDALFRSEHHSPQGNRATATAVMDALMRHRLLTGNDPLRN